MRTELSQYPLTTSTFTEEENSPSVCSQTQWLLAVCSNSVYTFTMHLPFLSLTFVTSVSLFRLSSTSPRVRRPTTLSERQPVSV